MRILFAINEVDYIDPMGIMLLSAIARKGGHETALSVLSGEPILDAVKRARPDIVAFSAKTGEHRHYISACDEIRRSSKGVFTIMGGPHPTFFPEMIERRSFDALCVGEGDDAWKDLLSAIEAKRPIHDIPNIVTRENFKAGLPVKIRDKRRELDSLPFLDRSIVYSGTRLKDFPLRSFITGRGCPYKCTYCFNHRYNMLYKGKGPLHVRYSVGRLIAELKELKASYPTQFIKFYDDIFTLHDDDWLREFAEEYPRRIGLPFHCLMRANLLTEGILKRLKKAGLKSISISIESASNETRNRVLRRNMTEAQIVDAFSLCRKHDIPTFSNTIFGIPGSSIEDDIASLELNLKCRVSFGEFPVFFPYPKTELSDYAMATGAFDGDFDSLHESYQSLSPLKCFTKREKLLQKNLSLLSTVCLFAPWLKGVSTRVLIRLPLTGLYFALYYMVKAYLVKTRIYPMRIPVRHALGSIFFSLRLERKKHSDKEGMEPAKGHARQVL